MDKKLTTEVGEPGVATNPLPEINDHNPVPTAGVLAAIVVVVTEHNV